MSLLPKSRLRIAGDLFRFNRLTDLLRPAQSNQYEELIALLPRFRAGDSLQIEVAVFNDGTLLTNLGSIERLQITIKPLAAVSQDTNTDDTTPNPDELRGPASNVAPILCKSVEASAFNASLTQAQWDSKAADKAHAIIRIDSGESALSPGERWLSLVAESTDGQTRTLAAGVVRILGGGATYNALPQPIVKDLRDQAAQSAQQAAQSAAQAQAQAATATTAAQAASANADATAAASQNAVQAATDASAAALLTQAQAAQSAAQALQYRNDAQSAASASARDKTDAEQAAQSSADSASAASAFASALSPNSRMVSGGIVFDGVRGYAVCAHSGATLAGDSLTLSMLVRLGDVAGESVLLCQGQSGSGGWEVFQSDASTIGIRLFRADASGIFTSAIWSSVISASTTHHVVITSDLKSASTPQFTLSVDGQAQETRVPANIGEYADANVPLYLATRNASEGHSETHIANLQLYNRKLSVAEITDLASSAGSIIPASSRLINPQVYTKAEFVTSSVADSFDFLGGSGSGAQGMVSDGERSILNPMVFTLDNTTGAHRITLSQMPAYLEDQPVEISLDYYIPTSNALALYFISYFSNSQLIRAIDTDEGERNLQITGKWARFSCVVRAKANGNNTMHRFFAAISGNNINFAGNGSDKVYIANIRVRHIGCTMHAPLQEGCGMQAIDHIADKHLLLTEQGASHLLSARTFEFIWSRSSSGFLGDDARAVLPERFVIEDIIWEDAKTVRTTASLGFNASNASAHVSSWQPTSASQRATLANASPAVTDRKLYLAMGANAGTITLRIRGRLR